MEGKKVLCHSCKNPIHIDHVAGMVMIDRKQGWFCDNICCLVEFDQFINSEKKGGLSNNAVK